jgi:hypothetical protein
LRGRCGRLFRCSRVGANAFCRSGSSGSRASPQGTDPGHPEYWGEVGDFDQRLAEMAVFGMGMAMIPETFYFALPKRARENLYRWLSQNNRRTMPKNNGVFFRILVNMGFQICGLPYDQMQLDRDFELIDGHYEGDGWYYDYRSQRDYYIPWAFHFYGLLIARLLPQNRHAEELANGRSFSRPISLLVRPFGRGDPLRAQTHLPVCAERVLRGTGLCGRENGRDRLRRDEALAASKSPHLVSKADIYARRRADHRLPLSQSPHGGRVQRAGIAVPEHKILPVPRDAGNPSVLAGGGEGAGAACAACGLTEPSRIPGVSRAQDYLDAAEHMLRTLDSLCADYSNNTERAYEMHRRLS